MSASTVMTRAALALMAGGATLMLGGLSPSSPFLTQAEARIGRPLTPLSYAGVARRTTRRAMGYGAAGAVAVGAYPYYQYPGAGCVQVVNAYGQIVYRCR
jgi:hypothetical protein